MRDHFIQESTPCQVVLRVLLWLCLICACYGGCGLKYQVSDLMADSTTFYFGSSKGNYQYQRYPSFATGLSRSFNSTPDMVISISSMDTDGSISPLSMFHVELVRLTPTKAEFELIKGEERWWQLQIHYWLSTRQDLLIGRHSLTFDGLQGLALEEMRLEKATGQGVWMARAFLNGLKLGWGSSMNIHVQVHQVQHQSLILHINVEENKLEQVWFSYIVFQPQKPSLLYTGGIIASPSFIGTKYRDIYQGLYPGYHLMGITALCIKHHLYFALHLDEDGILAYEVMGDAASVSLSYMFVAAPPRCSCNHAYIDVDECVERCPVGKYAQQLHKQTYYCKKCGQELSKTMKSGQCACMKGYEEVGQECRRVEVGGEKILPFNNGSSMGHPVIISQNCLGYGGTFWNGYGCVCKSGFQYKPLEEKCLPLITHECQEISLDQGLSCQCAEGSCVRNTCVKEICNIMFRCGNGRLDEGEYCDDGNIQNHDGCSSICRVEGNAACFSGTPWICYKLARNMKQVGDISRRGNELTLKFKTTPGFKFESQETAQKFFLFTFPDSSTAPSSITCIQASNDVSLLTCSLLYPVAIPSKTFKIVISFHHHTFSGEITFVINKEENPFARYLPNYLF